MMNIDIFCKVIDNFGDIGVCYRLAKELKKNNFDINLIVDDLASFQKICHEIEPHSDKQITLEKITVYKWEYFEKINIPPSKIIIETFACNIPSDYLNQITSKNIWINLEYLSAEKWIESCHKNQSLINGNSHKYFFFPGFTDQTGGLNYEKHIIELDKKDCRKKINNEFKLSTEKNHMFWVLIFTYNSTKIIDLMSEIYSSNKNSLFFIPNNVYNKLVSIDSNHFLNIVKKQIVLFDMLNQEKFNYLLRSTDLNVVRGEDSIAQANIISTPFIWDIYKQEDNIQLDKIQAFLEVYLSNVDKKIKNIIHNCFVYLNDSNQKRSNDKNIFFKEFMIKYNEISCINQKWSLQLQKNQSLCNNLIKFIQSKNDNI